MALNLRAFQEPRGVMRILQFIFAICAFATTSGFSNTLRVDYCSSGTQPAKSLLFNYEYPFKLDRLSMEFECFDQTSNSSAAVDFPLYGDFSSDSQFFVCTGVLSFLYCIGIIVLYALFDELYQSNALVPMADFILTVLLAVFWLSGSAAWSNGIAGIKSVTDASMILSLPQCKPPISCVNAYSGSFSSLNISAILGFLNFFLWASDLWFLYKETQWFKNANPTAPTSPSIVA